MPLDLFTFNDLVTAMENSLTSNTPKITNLRSGSVALAIIQAVAGNGLALEQLISHIYDTERLATSTGTDVDTFVGDFGMSRLPAKAAYGVVTLTRTTSGTVLRVPLGAIMQTLSKTQFGIIADLTQSAYDAVDSVYQFGSTDLSIDVTVQALVAGAAGNVSANTITQIVGGLNGISSLTNPTGFTTGADPETDEALRERFVLYLGSLAKANVDAVSLAISSVQPNVTYKIIEYKHFDGTDFVAGFTVVADNGTAAGQTPFLNAVYAAVDAVRAAGIQFEVHAPNNVTINSDWTLVYQAAYSPTVAQRNVIANLTNYIKSLGVGNKVSYATMVNIVENTAGVFAVTASTVNGGTVDIPIAQTELAVTGTVTFS